MYKQIVKANIKILVQLFQNNHNKYQYIQTISE